MPETSPHASPGSTADGDREHGSEPPGSAAPAENGRPARAQLADEAGVALARLGVAKFHAHEYGEAEQLLARALEVFERSPHADWSEVVQALNTLAALRLAQGRLDDAEPLLRRALSVAERQLGLEHPDVAYFLSNLAQIYLKRRQFYLAERLLLRLIAIRRRMGEDDPEVAAALANLALAREGTGEIAAAQELWRRVLTIREKTLPADSPTIALTLEHLADNCVASGETDEAVALRGRAIAIRERTLGPDHASVAAARAKLVALQPDGDGASRPIDRASSAPGAAAVSTGTTAADAAPAADRAAIPREAPMHVAPAPPARAPTMPAVDEPAARHRAAASDSRSIERPDDAAASAIPTLGATARGAEPAAAAPANSRPPAAPEVIRPAQATAPVTARERASVADQPPRPDGGRARRAAPVPTPRAARSSAPEALRALAADEAARTRPGTSGSLLDRARELLGPRPAAASARAKRADPISSKPTTPPAATVESADREVSTVPTRELLVPHARRMSPPNERSGNGAALLRAEAATPPPRPRANEPKERRAAAPAAPGAGGRFDPFSDAAWPTTKRVCIAGAVVAASLLGFAVLGRYGGSWLPGRAPAAATASASPAVPVSSSGVRAGAAVRNSEVRRTVERTTPGAPPLSSVPRAATPGGVAARVATPPLPRTGIVADTRTPAAPAGPSAPGGQASQPAPRPGASAPGAAVPPVATLLEDASRAIDSVAHLDRGGRYRDRRPFWRRLPFLGSARKTRESTRP